MEDIHVDDLLDMVDDLREDYGDVVDFDHIDETTKTFFVCRTSQFDPEDLAELREYVQDECPPYRIGSILRKSL